MDFIDKYIIYNIKDRLYDIFGHLIRESEYKKHDDRLGFFVNMCDDIKYDFENAWRRGEIQY